MILTILILVAICACARFVFFRYTGNALAAGVAAAAILVAFVAGSLAHTFAIPDRAATVAAAPTDESSAASAASPAAPAQPADTPQPDTALQNVTSRCAKAVPTTAVDAVGAIDVFNGDGGSSTRVADGIALPRNKRFALEGWSAARGGKTPSQAACLVVDGKVVPKAIDYVGVNRPDVANALAAPDLGKSGYRIVLPKDSLAPGAHAFRIAVEEQDGSFAFIGPRSFSITER